MTDQAQAGQQQTEQTRAVARRENPEAPVPLQDIGITAIAGREDIERVDAVVRVPKAYQYEIKGGHYEGRKDQGGRWVEEYKVGLTADGYDYLNRALGVTFYMPPTVHDETGREVPNPVHRPDYIFLRMVGVWYTPLGQMVSMAEDVEVDYKLIYHDARVNAKSAEVVMDETTGLPAFDGLGNPMLKLSKDDELKALKTLSQLRTFGIRYAQTVARVRILKAASGVRSLPLDRTHDIALRVTGFRDKLTVDERVAKARAASAAFFGREVDTKPLSAEEMASVGDQTAQEDAPDSFDRDRIERARAAEQEAEEPKAEAKPEQPQRDLAGRVGRDADEQPPHPAEAPKPQNPTVQAFDDVAEPGSLGLR